MYSIHKVHRSIVIVRKLYNVRYCTFKVQCTSLNMYTVVNGSTVIVCKLNVRYCTFKVQCTSLNKYTVVNGSTMIVCKLNKFRYCTCTFGVQCTLLTKYMYTVIILLYQLFLIDSRSVEDAVSYSKEDTTECNNFIPTGSPVKKNVRVHSATIGGDTG